MTPLIRDVRPRLLRLAPRNAIPAAALGVLCVASAGIAQAFEVTISSGTRSLFMVVGTGTMTGGTFSGGGTPGNSAVVNHATVALSATSLGTGPVAMTTDSTVTNSYYDNAVFCSVPAQVYVGGFYRTPGSAANATLTVSTPASLGNGAYTVPFSTISWVSSGIGDATPTLPSGSFVGGTSQTLLSLKRNTWFESCLQFSYANANLLPAGTFTGRATYTLTAP